MKAIPIALFSAPARLLIVQLLFAGMMGYMPTHARTTMT